MMPYRNDIPPYKIIHLEEVNSTNNYLQRIRLDGDIDEFTIAIADYQNAGKGQRGNSWESSKGKNLLFSIFLKPEFLEAKEQFIISQFTSLSIKEELEKYATGFSIKWPNDIYWNESKIAGILVENNLEKNSITECIIGIGININQNVFSTRPQNPVSLFQITDKQYDLSEILLGILQRFHDYYRMLQSRHIKSIVNKYHDSLFRKDGFHQFCDKEGCFTAKIITTESSGKLVVEDMEGKRKKYYFKEITYK